MIEHFEGAPISRKADAIVFFVDKGGSIIWSQKEIKTLWPDMASVLSVMAMAGHLTTTIEFFQDPAWLFAIPLELMEDELKKLPLNLKKNGCLSVNIAGSADISMSIEAIDSGEINITHCYVG